jgi:hypothetical protein
VHPDEPDVLGLRLGRDPLWLRPRLSTLLRRLADQRRPLAAALTALCKVPQGYSPKFPS